MRRTVLIVALACWGLLLAAAASAADPWWSELPRGELLAELPIDLDAAAADWDVGPGMAVVRDEILGRPVVEHTGRAVGWFRIKEPAEGPFEIVALVRMPDEEAGAGATLSIGVTGEGARPDAAYALDAAALPQKGRFSLRLTPTLGTGAARAYQTAPPIRPGDVKIPWPRPVTMAERYPDSPSGRSEAFGKEIEAAMAKIPHVHQAWFRLRIEQDGDAVRLWKDGLLVAEHRPAGRADGDAGLWLRGNVRVASLVVRRLDPLPEAFHPVGIDDASNAAAIDGQGPGAIRSDGLPPASVTVKVGEVPLVFPERTASGDHVDVAASLFHYRNEEGFFSARHTWPGPGTLDPARILLRVPNRPYQRMWVIAASDGLPDHVPKLTVRFYRPQAGFAVDAETEVPALSATSTTTAGVRRLPVTLADGKPGSLWLVPIDLDAVAIGSRFREEPALAIELTKEVHDYRAYPDPAAYDRFQGGPPSSVRIFAMTLEEAPLRLIASGSRTGNVYVYPEGPVWQVDVKNLRREGRNVNVDVTVTGPRGDQSHHCSTGRVGPQMTARFEFPVGTSLFGLHRVTTEVEADGQAFAQQGTFVQLPPDTRRAGVTDSRWGLWWWRGGHRTNPNQEEDLYLLRAAGTRVASARDARLRREWGMFPSTTIVVRGPEDWAYQDPYDPKEYEQFSEEVGRRVAAIKEESPDAQYFALFAENTISLPLTYGILPRYWGEPEYELNDEERAKARATLVTAKAAAEGIRRHAPKAKISLGWCEPTFTVPLLRAGYPKELMDAIGVDLPQFERMPEMPIRSVTPNRMWILDQEKERLGYGDVPVIHTESYFPPSHPLALGPRTAADYYVRTAVLSLALGSSRLLYCFTLHDCADYWGSTHYGCIGTIGPGPEHNPKPAFPAYATMTRMLDQAVPDGYVPTGSLSAYCVRFKRGRELVYCLWTIRGQRTASLAAAGTGGMTLTDESGNETALELSGGAATVTLEPTPIWVVSGQPIERIEVGPAVYAEPPGEHAVVLDPLDEPWTYDAGPYPPYAENHWDLPRFPGPMESSAAESPDRGSKVWRVALGEPPTERRLAAWYGVFQPPKPIAIPGRARAVGVWANGRSNWGRIIYEIEDARGEVWQSIGAKEGWNCDDVHNWSSFCFDGWRWLEFPLPGHLPGDGFRQKDTVWWNHSAEGVVDLPVKLTRIIIEHRTHHVYVNECVPVPDRSVELDDLTAVVDSAETGP